MKNAKCLVSYTLEVPQGRIHEKEKNLQAHIQITIEGSCLAFATCSHSKAKEHVQEKVSLQY